MFLTFDCLKCKMTVFFVVVAHVISFAPAPNVHTCTFLKNHRGLWSSLQQMCQPFCINLLKHISMVGRLWCDGPQLHSVCVSRNINFWWLPTAMAHFVARYIYIELEFVALLAFLFFFGNLNRIGKCNANILINEKVGINNPCRIFVFCALFKKGISQFYDRTMHKNMSFVYCHHNHYEMTRKKKETET